MNAAVFLVFGNFINDEQRQRRQANWQRRKLKFFRRNLRDLSDPFTMNPRYFRKYYRMSPRLAMQLIDLLHDSMVLHNTTTIPYHLQVLSALRFFAEGGYQKGVGQDFVHPLSQSTVSRCLHTVTYALSAISKDWIKLPVTREERELIKERFLQVNRIPGVLGLIDCVVVRFIRPTAYEEAFFHYKHRHAMNVQVITDDNYIIRSLRICLGSNNDRYIWHYSEAKQFFLSLAEDPAVLQEEGSYYLLGDSGYNPSTIMLTPLRNAEPLTPEAAYTEDHVTTRCKIEQTFGLLSNKWLGISRRRVLHYKPEKVARIIQASAVLHNYVRLNGVQERYNGRPHLPNPNVLLQESDYAMGINERQRIIDRFYN